MKPSLDIGNALTTMMMVAGSTVPQPSWGPLWTPELLARISPCLDEEGCRMIAAIADTLIPFNGKEGALSAGVDQYLIAYVTDCLTTHQQLGVSQGLARLDQIAHDKFGSGFIACGKRQREQVLLVMKGSDDEDLRMFFCFFQTRAVQGFITSEQVINKHPL